MKTDTSFKKGKICNVAVAPSLPVSFPLSFPHDPQDDRRRRRYGSPANTTPGHGSGFH